MLDLDCSRLGHKPDCRLGWSSEYLEKLLHECHSVSVACRPAETWHDTVWLFRDGSIQKYQFIIIIIIIIIMLLGCKVSSKNNNKLSESDSDAREFTFTFTIKVTKIIVTYYIFIMSIFTEIS